MLSESIIDSLFNKAPHYLDETHGLLGQEDIVNRLGKDSGKQQKKFLGGAVLRMTTAVS